MPALPLDNARCTPATLAMVATWLRRREFVAASVIEVPTPSLVACTELYDDEWDHAFLSQCVSAVDEATQDMVAFQRCHDLLLVAAYLGLHDLHHLVTSYVVFHLRRAVRQSNDAVGVARRWLGYAEGDAAWTDAEVDDAVSWAAESLQGLEYQRVERPFDHDAWRRETEATLRPALAHGA